MINLFSTMIVILTIFTVNIDKFLNSSTFHLSGCIFYFITVRSIIFITTSIRWSIISNICSGSSSNSMTSF
ncbi:unnamed protein product [Schistosoma mattheei]|uniref:Uncharacterized protein n=1 Tax=Schistosoma mattheei TaxID=31246 RepID=A0A183PDU3_9TREM|nr:unnamed protein product [Schistosoma mattheei]